MVLFLGRGMQKNPVNPVILIQTKLMVLF